MRSTLKLGKSRDLLFIIIFSFIFFLLRLPSLFEPHWYGDEGIYQVIGTALSNGSLLYRDIWDNKPPLLYLLYAIFNSDQFTLRLVSLIFGVLSVVVFFFLSKKLFPPPATQRTSFILTALFVFLFATPFLEGNIANAENFMLLPILAAAFLIFSFPKKLPNSHLLLATNRLPLFFSGILLGLAFLFKVVAIFDFLAFSLFLLFCNYNLQFISNRHSGLSRISHRLERKGFWSRFAPQNDEQRVLKRALKRKLFPFFLGFCIPIGITSLFFLLNSAFIDFFRATFSSNIGYVTWQNKLILPLGLLLLRTALLLIAIIFIAGKRRALSLNAIFILLWFAFSLFNAFFTQRPYTHYLLILLPSFAFMIGLILWEKKYQKPIALFFILAFVLLLKNFDFYGKTIAYYQNFVSFIMGTKTVSSYRAFFDKRTLIDYEIATFLKGKVRKKDSIFIWGDNAQVYKLVGVTPPGRYIVAYHIRDNKDGMSYTKDAIEKAKPKFIIVMPDQEPPPFQLIRYSERIIIGDVSIYERFL